MTVTISGTSGITTPGLSSSAASSFSANVSLAGAAVKLLNNSGNPVVQQTGSVLQVVQGTYSGAAVVTSSASFVNTGLTASITPSSATNKILVTISGGDLDTTAAGRQILATIYRNSTNIGNTNGFTDVYDTAGRLIAPVSIQYLDSPATTSSTTYTLYFTGQGTTVVYNGQSGIGVITLMEIAA